MRPEARVFWEEAGLPVRKTVLAAAMVLALSPAWATEAPAPTEAAMAFVGQFSDDHLSGMLSRVGGSQPAMVAASQLNGALVAAVFDAEIDKAVTAHGPDWQRAMARSWTGLMTDEQFTSLMEQGADSPHAETYLGLRNQAGQKMQANAGELFRQILAQVIENTVKELGAEAAPSTE
jgi:hypothetical protein